MEVNILHLTQGAREAKGITVIIDVFRAYTTESWAFYRGARRVYPVPLVEDALALGRQNPGWLVAGERGGKKLPGFNFGNSPFELSKNDLSGKTLVHCTSAGTQGIAAATGASEILVGALVNAKATASYIASKNPEFVSLVCMGKENVAPTPEDTFCAEYIKSLLLGTSFDKEAAVAELRISEGARFFDPANVSFSPAEDFYLCTQFDRFSYVLKVNYDEKGLAYVEPIAPTVNAAPNEGECIALPHDFDNTVTTEVAAPTVNAAPNVGECIALPHDFAKTVTTEVAAPTVNAAPNVGECIALPHGLANTVTTEVAAPTVNATPNVGECIALPHGLANTVTTEDAAPTVNATPNVGECIALPPSPWPTADLKLTPGSPFYPQNSPGYYALWHDSLTELFKPYGVTDTTDIDNEKNYADTFLVSLNSQIEGFYDDNFGNILAEGQSIYFMNIEISQELPVALVDFWRYYKGEEFYSSELEVSPTPFYPEQKAFLHTFTAFAKEHGLHILSQEEADEMLGDKSFYNLYFKGK